MALAALRLYLGAGAMLPRITAGEGWERRMAHTVILYTRPG